MTVENGVWTWSEYLIIQAGVALFTGWLTVLQC